MNDPKKSSTARDARKFIAESKHPFQFLELLTIREKKVQKTSSGHQIF
jgi:hypothetical protein